MMIHRFQIQHHNRECSEMTINCPFNFCGCNRRSTRSQIRAHMIRDLHIHALLFRHYVKMLEFNDESRLKLSDERMLYYMMSNSIDLKRCLKTMAALLPFVNHNFQTNTQNNHCKKRNHNCQANSQNNLCKKPKLI